MCASMARLVNAGKSLFAGSQSELIAQIELHAMMILKQINQS